MLALCLFVGLAIMSRPAAARAGAAASAGLAGHGAAAAVDDRRLRRDGRSPADCSSTRFPSAPIRASGSAAKVIFLILAGLNVWLFHTRRRTRASRSGTRAGARRGRAAGRIFSLILWACIIVAGRFIAYNWFDCDIQPQPAFVNWFAGCVVPPPRINAAALLPMVRDAGHRPGHRRLELAVSGDRVESTCWRLALLGGSVLIVDLRLLGLGLRDQRDSELAREARPWPHAGGHRTDDRHRRAAVPVGSRSSAITARRSG